MQSLEKNVLGVDRMQTLARNLLTTELMQTIGNFVSIPRKAVNHQACEECHRNGSFRLKLSERFRSDMKSRSDRAPF